ncbi:MAG TPA: hypothetical protein VFR89_05570 [candidate division Zixibacteria bacterium]|nr:hypothetical protein [candidate division Zixibacteria bacterium]
MIGKFRQILVVAIVLTVAAGRFTEALAQSPSPPVHLAIGFGVDTTTSPHGEILALYRAYLTHRLDSLRPNPYWSTVEQKQWPVFDLLAPYIYQGFSNFTVVQLAPAAGLDSAYLIRTLISSVDDSTLEVRPLALYRVYAVREDGKWVLANALPRLTGRWNREKIGRITFLFPPGRSFARARAKRTALFVDSLARAFEIPPPPAIDYYFTDDLSETLRALGLEFFPLGSDTVGGRSSPGNHQVFIGSSKSGEDYRHELAHVILWPFLSPFKAAGLVQEGLMTWVGGSAGLDFKELMPGLKRYLDAHPELTLESIMTNPPQRQGTLDVGYNALAVLCKMVYEAGGLAAIRKLASAGYEPRAVLDTAAQILNVSPSELDELWRNRIAALSR